MKKLIISMFALAAVLSSCSKSEVMDSRYENIPISFTTYNGRTPEVKATETNSTNLNAFQIMAYSGTALYDNLNTTYVYTETNGTGSWAFGNGETYYWPGNNPLDFFAYAPIEDAENTNSIVKKTETPTTIEINIPTEVKDQVDVVAAVEKNQTISNVDATSKNLTLNFNHLLSRIHFAVDCPQDADIDITSLSLKGDFINNCTIDLTGETNPTYTLGNTKNDYSYIAENDACIFATETTANVTTRTGVIYPTSVSTEENRYMMIIPQTITNGSIEVTYSFNNVPTTLTGDNAIKFGTANEGETNKVFTFVPGKSYLFTLQVASNGISFDVDVTSWDEDTLN